MAWRDNLLPAKLDNVTFLYRSVKDKGGRRVVPFEYPGRNDPFIEDLGKKANTWQVEAFLLGENYLTDLGDLLDVLDKPGVRKFQHPYRGEFPVKLIGEYEVTQTDTEGRMATISFTLMEAGLSFPLIAIDTPAKIGILVPIALAALEADTKFNLLGAIKDVINSVLGALGKALSTINAVNGKIGAALSLADTASFLIDSIADGIGDLLNSPFALMNKLNGLLTSVLGLIANFVPDPQTIDVEDPEFPQAEILMTAFQQLFQFQAVPATVPTQTPQSDIELLNFQAVNLNIKAASLAITSSVVADLALDSSDDAAAIQAVLAESFDEILGVEGLPVETFEAFAALKAAVVEHLVVAQQQLPSLSSYTPQQTMPALVIAHELYGDATRDKEVIRRNNIRHPCFVPGGVPLEVISDD